ncbi:MAG: transglycosylase domain-containing protein [Chloroflexi bacterium]|nr:transglycosylase domain-containing protein [Chloroflexota bacterium]
MTTIVQVIRRRRNRRAARKAAAQRGRVWAAGAVFAVLLGVIAPLMGVFGLVGWFYVRALALLPAPESTIYLDPLVGATELYDREGRLLLYSVLDPLGDERVWLTLDEMPPYLRQATLLAEDPDFLQTARFDAAATFSRLWENLLSSSPLPADASLTGRLVRNAILPQPDFVTFENRALEIALVAEINRRYTPNAVLEWHLNTNYYGHDAYGIEAAARVYLGKRAAELSLAEVALLAAIPTAPQYNPLDNEQAAFGRQNDLLRALVTNGDITETLYSSAINTPLTIQADTLQSPPVAPEFAVYARRQAEEMLDATGRDGARLVARGGLRITTTLDLDLYYQAECALRAHLAQLNSTPAPTTALNGLPCAAAAGLLPVTASGAPPDEGAVVILNAQSGELLAVVGAGTRNLYAPGPTLQPFVYFQGLGSGLFTPATMLLDISRPFPGAAAGLIYLPGTRDGQYRGPLSLREALAVGLLPPAVYVANTLQIDNILTSAHFIGLNSLNIDDYDLSLLERGGAVSVLDMAYAYSVFANLGRMYGVQVEPLAAGFRVRDPAAVLRIEDSDGALLWQYDDLARLPTNIFDPGLGYLINDMLADREARWSLLPRDNVLDMVNRGGAPRPVAVVNGVTGSSHDAWTVGYTPQIVTGVRLGRGDGGDMLLDAYGLTGAAPLWRALMDYVHARDALPIAEWQRPPNIVTMTVCQISGLLPTAACPTHQEMFLQNVQPAQLDTYWQSVVVNSETGQLATSNTPNALRQTRVFFVPPADALDWWRANGQPLPPTEYDTIARPNLLSSATILQPQAFAYVGGSVDVRGSIDTAQMQYYQLAYGAGINPDAWQQIGGQQTSYVSGQSLGAWDTTGLDGIYTLRLSVVLSDNTVEIATVYVTVDNLPPAVSLSTGTDGSGAPRVYVFPTDAVVNVVAEVSDNLALDRVEFYHNGEFLGADTEWPYRVDWPITRTGTETFTAVAFDRVGNSAGAEIVVAIGR